MVYTTDVERPNTSPGKDGDNLPLPATGYSTVLTGQKCNVSQSITVLTGEQQNKDLAIIVGRYNVTFPYNSDVQFVDRLKNLKDRDGNLVDPAVKFYEVRELIPDDTALTVSVQAIH